MCPQIKRLHYLCKKLKQISKIHYYTFFNGNLRVQVVAEGEKKFVSHITDLEKLTGLPREEIELLEWLPTVVNRNMLKRGWQLDQQYTYIGRPGFWGNPNKLSMFNDRSDCIIEYEKYARASPNILGRLP